MVPGARSWLCVRRRRADRARRQPCVVDHAAARRARGRSPARAGDVPAGLTGARGAGLGSGNVGNRLCRDRRGAPDRRPWRCAVSPGGGARDPPGGWAERGQRARRLRRRRQPRLRDWSRARHGGLAAAGAAALVPLAAAVLSSLVAGACAKTAGPRESTHQPARASCGVLAGVSGGHGALGLPVGLMAFVPSWFAAELSRAELGQRRGGGDARGRRGRHLPPRRLGDAHGRARVIPVSLAVVVPLAAALPLSLAAPASRSWCSSGWRWTRLLPAGDRRTRRDARSRRTGVRGRDRPERRDRR
jgi:hypothetical protein